jgi:hypothetical protein
MHLLSARGSLDSSFSQPSTDAAPPPEPSPELPAELSADPSPELSPEPPQGSQPSQPVVSVHEDPVEVLSPGKVGSLGSNPSQDSASSRSSHRSLGTNISPRKDKGKGKAEEIADDDAEQPKGSSQESSGSHATTVPQPASTPAEGKKKGQKSRRPRHSHLNKPQRGGESSLPQNGEPSQTNDSQERQQGMTVHLVRAFRADNLCFAFQFNRSLFPTTAVLIRIRRIRIGRFRALNNMRHLKVAYRNSNQVVQWSRCATKSTIFTTNSSR